MKVYKKKENQYYYFDIYGFNQALHKPIYEITDKEVLDYLLLNFLRNKNQCKNFSRTVYKDKQFKRKGEQCECTN